ncbi:MAG TPA: anti-sigma factor [Actinomycetota bacterium]|nr:anti-sigma factor [Actinomycetota bacterium]
MSDIDHDRIDELLAGYVLRSLSGPDGAEADHLLAEHVPGCARCRETLTAFQAVAADLALDASPIDPPETLLPQLHRELEPRGSRPGRWSPARIVAVAASLVLVVGLGGLLITQLGGSGTPMAPADLERAMKIATTPGAKQTDLGHATEITAPGVEQFVIFGTDVPSPPQGTTYRLWAISDGPAKWLGDFVPDDGRVILLVSIDPTTFDRLLITTAPAGSQPSTPGSPAWAQTG